jgi:glycosyltransferase involved in cell wall biosynthesis
MTVSIIVCFFERLAHLRRCLDSLALNRRDFDEVVVADDGSTRATVDQLHGLIARYPYEIRHVWQPHEGFRVAAARNRGVAEARGRYLIFFDCDFLILPGTVAAHLSHARAGRFVAGQCKFLDRTPSEDLLAGGITADGLERLYASLPERPLRQSHRRFIKRTLLMRLGLVSYRKQSLGGHLSLYRQDFVRINGYDENFVGWGGEDEDLGKRLVRAGVYCRSAIPRARVLHVWHPRQVSDADWQQAPNRAYFRRRDIPAFCENGLVKRR